MSYIIVRVYSFECDNCGQIYDNTPLPGPGQLKRAEQDLRREGWTARDTGTKREHLCERCTAMATYAAEQETHGGDGSHNPGVVAPDGQVMCVTCLEEWPCDYATD